MSTTAIRQFPNDTFSVLDEDGEAHLVAFDENAVYGVELAFPESDEDAYRVNLVRSTRQAQGIEVEQRLTLAEHVSNMEAEEHFREVTTALYEQGREAIADHLPALQAQPAEYAAGYMVASYPPDAVFTGESASVSVLALRECGVQDALVGWNLSPWEASHLAMVLEDAQAEGGAVALLQTATEEARTHGMIQEHQPLFPTSPHSPLAYLDQRDQLAYQAEIVPSEPDAWGWHEARFTVLSDGNANVHQVALLDVYRDALTGDMAGEYLPISQHATASEAEQACDGLIERALDGEARQVAEGVIEDPVWQPMQPEHYDLYERLAGFAHEPDFPPDAALVPLLVEAMRLGAVERNAEHDEVVVGIPDLQQTDLEKEAQGMPNTLKAESQHWQVDLNEHVTHLPPYVTAEYRSPENAEGVAPVRLRPEGEESMYGLEVSAPDDANAGAVRLAAIKTFDSEILYKPVTEFAILKTYHPSDYDESVSYLNPRSEALSDARALVYEWGRADLDHAMGSALLLAQENGFKGDKLFEQGPPDTFAPVADTRRLETIQIEREWERDAEMFGKDGYRIPQPDGLTHARELGRYGVDPEMEPGQFYGVTVREAHLGAAPDPDYPPVYIVEGVKAWLDKDSNEVGAETVTLDVRGSREASLQVADQLADEVDLPSRLEHMETLAHQAAVQHQGLTLPLLGEAPADRLNLTLREEGLFTQGPPDPERLRLDEALNVELPALDLSEEKASIIPHSFSHNYSRTIGEAAYDLPIEEGQSYAFQARRLEALEDRVAAYGVDAMAFEAVKRWDADGEPHHEVVTLGIHYDRDDARQEVDTYVDLAEQEGIQEAMSRAAMLATVQNYPEMVDDAKELDLHINPDAHLGELFKQGPPDPFLPDVELQAEKPPTYHELSIEVVPVHHPSGQSLGQAVVALDAEWEHKDMWTGLEQAQSVTAYEVAHFDDKREADFYVAALHEYCFKRDLDMEGSYITPALDFFKGVQSANGLEQHEHRLDLAEVAQVKQGEWAIQQSPGEFHPMMVEPPPALPVTIDLEW